MDKHDVRIEGEPGSAGLQSPRLQMPRAAQGGGKAHRGSADEEVTPPIERWEGSSSEALPELFGLFLSAEANLQKLKLRHTSASASFDIASKINARVSLPGKYARERARRPTNASREG